MIRVLIADDDFGMRMILRKIISKNDEFELVGEAENGIEAVQLFEEVNPDVVFLDIEMPKLNGIECARKIFDINPKAIIVFATAHEGFMSEAFEVYAFDYLMKPFNMERIKTTLDRILQTKENREGNEVLQNIQTSKIPSKLVIKNKEGITFIDVDDIVVIQREQRSTVIYTTNNKYITSESLGSIEEKLNSEYFMRSHKSYIMNIRKISNIYPYGRWTYIVKFGKYDVDALLTHKNYEELEKLFMN